MSQKACQGFQSVGKERGKERENLILLRSSAEKWTGLAVMRIRSSASSYVKGGASSKHHLLQGTIIPLTSLACLQVNQPSWVVVFRPDDWQAQNQVSIKVGDSRMYRLNLWTKTESHTEGQKQNSDSRCFTRRGGFPLMSLNEVLVVLWFHIIF